MPKNLKKLLYPAAWLTNSLKLMLSSLPIDKGVPKKETSRVNAREKAFPKTVFGRGDQGCRIISVN